MFEDMFVCLRVCLYIWGIFVSMSVGMFVMMSPCMISSDSADQYGYRTVSAGKLGAAEWGGTSTSQCGCGRGTLWHPDGQDH